MSSHTVFRLTSGNSFERLQAFKEPIPAIDKYEVLVKVRSVSLNYRDVIIATSKYPLPVKDNVVPCSDMAGEVVEVGSLVDGFSVGDRVIAPLTPSTLYGRIKTVLDTYGGPIDGFLKEYVALPAHILVKLPETSHSFAQWASLVCTGSTAWNALYGGTPLTPGETVLVQGTGGVSLTALIFAKAAGATTIVTSSSDKKLEYVKSTFGADYTINYKTHPDWSNEVKRITKGRGVDHIIDVSGAGTIRQSIESVAYGGIISAIGFLSMIPQDEMPDVTMLTLVKGCTIRGVLGGSKQELEDAARFMANRQLSMPVDKTFAFNRDDIIAALEYVKSGQHIGKVCINLE